MSFQKWRKIQHAKDSIEIMEAAFSDGIYENAEPIGNRVEKYTRALEILTEMKDAREIDFKADNPKEFFENHVCDIIFLEPDYQTVSIPKLKQILDLFDEADELTICSAEDRELEYEQASLTPLGMMCFVYTLYKPV